VPSVKQQVKTYAEFGAATEFLRSQAQGILALDLFTTDLAFVVAGVSG
jgi:hypothetical protein